MNAPMRGVLRKMKTEVAAGNRVQYQLRIGGELFPLNQRIGKRMRITHTGNIFCIACAKKIKKTFSRGYCFACAQSLAECDLCIVRPHTCHHHLGTCRDENWAAAHCMQAHCVYIANSSALKIGITGAGNTQTRWVDQGATQAAAVFTVQNRLHSGLIEHALKQYASDRTDWRKMLRGTAAPLDLQHESARLMDACASDLAAIKKTHPGFHCEVAPHAPREFVYPVLRYPQKISAFSFDKCSEIAGTLTGIKGQYLMFDHGVVNVRKFGGYEVALQ